ncbi:MAG TPA: PEP-CTERM sorting domain-containing protein [Rariglobus sp.]
MNTLYPKLKYALASAGLLLLAVPSFSAETPVFSETFDYANQAALMGVWTKVDASVSTPSIGSNAGVSDSPYLTSPNSLIKRELGTTISADTSWTLSFDVIHTAYSRGGWIGLFDAAGKNGYVALWDSGSGTFTAPATAPSSTFSIRSFSSDTAIASWNASLTNRGSIAVSGNAKSPIFNAATNSEFVTVTLSWNADTDQLMMSTSIAGSSTATVSATGIDVASIYIRGNSTVYFDNLLVTAAIPEPATFAGFAGAAVLLAAGLVRRRRGLALR